MRIPIFLFVLSILGGCSSVSSIRDPLDGRNDGLVYYMPKKDFLITIVKADEKITTVSLTTTAAYPDMSRSYVLNHGGNLFGKNTLKVGVDINGLLKSSKSTTVSGVTDALRNLGESLGTLHGFRADPADLARQDTCGNGTHTFIYRSSDEAKRSSPCGLDVTITKLENTKSLPTSKPDRMSHSGIFYRQAEPYLITAIGSINTSAVAYSPSDSPVYFLPVSRTFFSNNEADFEFTEGMPTKYNQETEGELIALFKLPATVISAYFTATGTIFDSFKNRDLNEADTLVASVKLELAKKKYEACLAAINAGDDTMIVKLECGK